MLTIQDLVQFHRRGGTSSLPDADWPLEAAVEHLVWQSTTNALAPTVRPRCESWDLLCRSGWPSNGRSCAQSDLGTYVLPLKDDGAFLRDVEMTLRGRITNAHHSLATAKALTGALSEIIANVWTHAEATTPGLIVYRVAPQSVQLIVADLGIGVLQSLRSNPTLGTLTTSMVALKKAMQVGVSRFPEQGRGYGFDTVVRAVADHGSVRLRTGEAILEFNGATDVRQASASYGTNLMGLQVAMSYRR